VDSVSGNVFLIVTASVTIGIGGVLGEKVVYGAEVAQAPGIRDASTYSKPSDLRE